MSNDIDKHLSAAMGDDGDGKKAEVTSTPKATLRTPPLVAAKAPDVVIAPEPTLSYEMLKLMAKNDALQELLAEERALARIGKGLAKKDAKAVDEDAEPEEMVNFRVHLPSQADKISIDSREYYHGFTYSVGKRQADSMRDIQAQSWRHDDQVRGFRPHSRGSSTGGIQIDGNGNQVTSPVMGFQ